jgi:DNA-binding MarR family transcriptional regulator
MLDWQGGPRTGDDVTDLRQVFDDLVRFETILWGTVDDRLQRECGVTLSTLNVMLVIEATPMCRVQDIAQALAITVGGTSQAVDRLEAAGRCARRANPADRRSSILELTPAGKALLSSAAPVFDRELDRLLRAPLPGTALTQLAAALSTLRRSAAAEAGGSATTAALKQG